MTQNLGIPSIGQAQQVRNIPLRQQGICIPQTPARVPTPAEAIAPTSEAIEENQIPQSDPAFPVNSVENEPECPTPASERDTLSEAFEYINDLDEAGKRDFVQPIIKALKERLAKDTLSANDVAKCLNLSHTRITRNFPNGTKLSYILANMPRARSIDPGKLICRLSASAKKELLEKLQQELL